LKFNKLIKNSVRKFTRLSSALIVGGLLLGGQAALAAPFSFEYCDTILSGSGSFPTGLAFGDSVKVTVVLDNTGASNASQTWTSAHLQSITYDFKNGTLVTTFTTPFGGGFTNAAGDFVTDATGTLTDVPDNLSDSSLGADFTTNGVSPTEWYLDSGNDKYYATGGNTAGFAFAPAAGVAGEGNLSASRWRAGSAVACPPLGGGGGTVSAPIFSLKDKPAIFSEEVK